MRSSAARSATSCATTPSNSTVRPIDSQGESRSCGSPSSAPAMSALSPAPASRSSASTSSASTRTAPRSRACATGDMPIFEPGLDKLVENNVQGRSPRLLDRPHAGGEGGRCRLHRRGHAVAAAATAMPISPTSMPPPRRSPRPSTAPTVVVTKSTVPVGTGSEVARILREARPVGRVRRRLQSGIPARRLGHRRFHAPRPGRHRRRDRARARGDAPALPAALSDRDADPVHQHRDGGADQIRGQHLPRHQDHLHQRDRRSLREGRRQRQ